MRQAAVSAALALCLAVLIAPATAWSDADPASDVLLVQNVFFPYSSTVSGSVQKTLNEETARAKAAGFPIKVALIANPFDLGGIPSFFGKPEPYAKFLDVEISFVKTQPVLVVMAAGLGGSGLGPGATAALAKLPPPAGKTANLLAEAAVADVPKLAAAAGHPIATDTSGSTSGGGGSSLTLILVLAIALALIALVLVVLRDRRRRTTGA